jgi:hypothetical protein
MPAYAAIATEKGYIFCGGEPESTPKSVCRQELPDARPVADAVQSFMSSKISGLRMLLSSTKECMMRNPFSKIRDFSVNDCPRKVQAKNEKRRNRKQKQQCREMAYTS